MADPSYPFTPLLITLIPKDKSLRNPSSSTLSPFNANILPVPFSSLPSIPKTLPSILLRSKPCTMMSAKGQSSSRRKGKEVARDPPAAHEVGEEVIHSEPDHSDEEETQRTPDSECAPLIDPWYDIHPHFSKVPGEYTPPPGRVWLALCRRNTDTSWAPLASSIYDLIIREGISLPVPTHFEYGDLFNLRHLVRRWCTTTHTFFFSCSEITVTLEDVADQLLLPIFGDADPSALELSPEEEAIETELKKRMSGNAKLVVGYFFTDLPFGVRAFAQL
ncbi:hypothetical protein SO802_010354 [Lithocarpus litseifolius]|uniref:Aminotransferase-like plant mobile domain-containing protein n=1 Tax=Lithocarpus litseifolius TaxID=425828 RepID=A0AAW2DG93_9ROSI